MSLFSWYGNICYFHFIELEMRPTGSRAGVAAERKGTYMISFGQIKYFFNNSGIQFQQLSIKPYIIFTA